MSEIVLTINDVELVELYGQRNTKLNIIKKAYPDITFTSRGNKLKIVGDNKKETQAAKGKIEMMVRILREHDELTKQMIEDILQNENPFANKIAAKSNGSIIVHGKRGNAIKPRTVNQKKMVDISDSNDIVFAIGPAGTGKTYVAVALAVRALKNKLVKKIILTRPAVEAGENLGFLPGDLKEKVDPYLRPLYDALDDMIPLEKLNFFMQNRVIEVAPLAFMRGRTLDNAFVILDEAQNTTPIQLKMFLTRLGPSAKAIITGDMTQIDLGRGQRSGLYKALDILTPLEGIGLVTMTAEDVVRHRLVKSIIKAYDKDHKLAKARLEKKKAEENGQIDLDK